MYQPFLNPTEDSAFNRNAFIGLQKIFEASGVNITYDPRSSDGTFEFVSLFIGIFPLHVRGEKILQTVNECSQTKCIISKENITTEETNKLLLVTVDNILKNISATRSFSNRILAVSYMFTDQLAEFERWILEDYIENDLEVFSEIHHEIDRHARSSNTELNILSRNPDIRFHPSDEVLGIIKDSIKIIEENID